MVRDGWSADGSRGSWQCTCDSGVHFLMGEDMGLSTWLKVCGLHLICHIL